jgi:porin
VRVRVRPVDSLTFLAGVFNGSPVANNTGDPQQQNSSGTSFPLNGGTLAIVEMQYAYPSLGAMVSAGQSEPLARLYKLGVWYDSENFADEELDNNGLSLANPAGSHIPLKHHGDYAIYGVMDQMIWRCSEEEDADRTLNFFARAQGAPEEDRNLIDCSVNAGLTFHEPVPHRDDDTFGVGMGFAKISDRAAALDRDTSFFTGTFHPVRSNETYVEATYQYQVTPWWQLQPDIQYVFKPGAGALNPGSPGQAIKNETVVGLRTNLLF